LFATFYLSTSSFAGSGFFEDAGASRFIEAAINNNGTTTYERVSQWSSKNFGNLTGNTFDLKGGVAWTYENSGDNIYNVLLYYRVYSGTTPSGSFSSLNLSTVSLPGGGDEKREIHGQTINLLSGLNASTTYTLEIYFEGQGVNGTTYYNVYWNNGGSNYKAVFTTSGSLPVSLINFSAFLTPQNQAELSWSTASELNASHFNVHRSDNGIEKQAIGVVSAQGNSNEIVEYYFVDVEPVNGQAFYFLEQVDFDGKTEWFGPVKVSNAVNNQADAVFGVNNDIVITLNGSIEMDRLEAKLFNMQGQLIKSTEFLGDQMSRELSVKVTDLPSGIYMLYLQSDNMEQAIKLIK
jgi:hypothetical protein